MAETRLDGIDRESVATGESTLMDDFEKAASAIAEEVAWRQERGMPIFVDRGNGVEDLSA